MALSKSIYGPAAWKQTWPVIPPDVSSISIEQATETMTVSFIDTSGRRTSLNFRNYRFSWSDERIDDLFKCLTVLERPELRFYAEVESGGIEFYGITPGGSVINVHLLKSVDGSLIVRWSKMTVFYNSLSLPLGLFPITRVHDIWYRYPLVELEEPAKR